MSTTASLDRLIDGVKDSLVEHAIVTISVRDVVRLSGLTERSIRKFIAEGKLKSVKVGARRLLDYQDVKRFVRSNGNGAA